MLVTAKGIASTNAQLGTVDASARKAGAGALSMGSRFARAAKIAAAALAVTLGVGLSAAISKGMEFERQMSSLGAVTEANVKQSKALEKQALKLGEATQYSASETAEAQIELAKGGLKTKEIIGGALPAALDLAAAGQLELADAATATVNAMKLFGLSGRESQQVADMFATAANTTTADVLDFAMALTQGGSAAKQAGLGLNESVVILEALAEAGIKNSDAGTSLKTSLIQLLAPTNKQAEAANALGIEWTKQNGTIKTAAGLSRELRIATDEMTKAERLKTFATLAGTDGFRTLAALYDAGPAKLRKLAAENERTGTAQEVASRKMDNLKGDVEQLEGAFETLEIKLMHGASPALREVTQNVTGMVQEINGILGNHGLDDQEKATRIFDLLAKASSDALTEMAEQAAHFGPRWVMAFADGLLHSWTDMSPLARLVSVGFLFRAFGGKGAIVGAGAAVGRWLGIGMSSSAASTIAGTGSGAAVGGGVLGALSKVKWARVGALGLGVTLADATVNEFARRAAERSNDIGEALNAMSNRDPLGVGVDIWGDLSKLPLLGDSLTHEERVARNISAEYEEMLEKRVRISAATEETLRREASELDLTKQQRVQVESMLNVIRGGRELGIKVDLGMDPTKLRELKAGFSTLRSGVLTSMKDIGKVTRDNAKLIETQLPKGSEEARKKLAQNMRDAAIGIGKGMASGDIEIKKGLARQKELFRNASLISGADPFGIARGFRESWKEAGGVNDKARKEAIQDLGKMPPAARQKAFDTMMQFGRELANKKQIPLNDLRDFRSEAITQFDELRSGGTQSSLDLAIGISNNFGSMGSAVGNVLEIIRDNSNSALVQFGAKKLEFAVKAVGSFLGFGGGGGKGKPQGNQQGGFIVPGSWTGDRPGFMGESGAYVLNREATRAYGFLGGGGIPLALESGERYFSPPEVKAIGPATLEAMNSAVPRQDGGFIGRPEISGPSGALRDIAQRDSDTVWKAARAFVEKRRPSPGQSGGSSFGYTGPPADMKQLGDAAWVDAHTLAVVSYIAKKFGLTVNSTYRDPAHNAAVGGVPNSDHTHGSPANPGAADFSPPSSAALAWAQAHIAGLDEALIHDAGSGLHLHLGFFQKGGLVQALAEGGFVDATDTQKNVALHAARRLLGYGLNAKGASGVVGNAWRESRWIPSSIGTGGRGLWGFDFYEQQLLEQAAEKGVPWSDIDFQTDFMWSGPEPASALKDALNGQSSAAAAAKVFDSEWEHSGIKAMSERMDGAREVMRLLGGEGGELTAGQKKLAEGKRRKANHEKHLAALEREVRESHTLPSKQSKLWRLVKFWGRTGMFEKGEKAHILQAVADAASQVKPQGAVNVLSHLADYAKGHGEITGQDPSNFRDFEKAIERAQDRGRDQRKKTVERQKKHVDAVHARVSGKISSRAAFPEWVAALGGLRKGADDQEELISEMVSLEPENLSDAYVGMESAGYGDELNRLLSWRNKVIRAQLFATEEIGRFEKQISDIEALGVQDANLSVKSKGKKGAKGKAGLGGAANLGVNPGAYDKQKYKLPLLEEAIAKAKTMRDETWSGELEEIQGAFGGHDVLASLPTEPSAGAFGGRIFEVQNSIRELGLRVSSASDEAATEIKQLEAQLNVDWHKRFLVSEAQRNTIADFTGTYSPGYAGMFATGGTIPRGHWGIVGENGPEPVFAGDTTSARVFSNREGREMLSGGDTYTFVVNGNIVQEPGDSRDPVEILRNGLRDPGVRAELQKITRDTRAGRRGPGGGR